MVKRRGPVPRWVWLGMCVALAASVLFLPRVYHQLIFRGFERLFPFRIETKIGNNRWGGFRLEPIIFRREKRYEGEIENMEVTYPLLKNLLGRKLELTLWGEALRVRFLDEFLAQYGFSSITFETLNAMIERGRKGDWILPFGWAQGKELMIHWRGKIARDETLDLDLNCLMTQNFVKRIPSFLGENLFASAESPIQRLAIRIEGKLSEPRMSFRSDLATLEVKTVAKP